MCSQVKKILSVNEVDMQQRTKMRDIQKELGGWVRNISFQFCSSWMQTTVGRTHALPRSSDRLPLSL